MYNSFIIYKFIVFIIIIIIVLYSTIMKEFVVATCGFGFKNKSEKVFISIALSIGMYDRRDNWKES